MVWTTRIALLVLKCLLLIGLNQHPGCEGTGGLGGTFYKRHVQRRNADGVLKMPCRIYQIHQELKTFVEAEPICAASGHNGQLAKIPNSVVNEALYSLFVSSMLPDAYFGARDELAELEWVYQDGSPVCFEDWTITRPVSDVTVNCATFTGQVLGHWVDSSCTTERTFICQYTDGDDCAGNPCLNSGTCIDGFLEYTCDCPAGYSGTNCEIEPDGDDCADDPCLNGGTCVDGFNEYTCNCPTGYSGTNCEIETVSTCGFRDQVVDFYCENGRECFETVCDCGEHFTGTSCETCVSNDADVSGVFSDSNAIHPTTLQTGINSAVTSFTLNTDVYLVTYESVGTVLDINIHRFVPGNPPSYTFFQTIPETGVKHVEAFKISGQQYLAIAQYDTSDNNAHSSIYRLDDATNLFEKIQTVVTTSVREDHFHFFVSSHGYFLVQSSDGNPVLYQWDESGDTFVPFQVLQGISNTFKSVSFTENTDTYLVFGTYTSLPNVFVQTASSGLFSSVPNVSLNGVFSTYLFDCKNYVTVATSVGFGEFFIHEWDSATQTFNQLTSTSKISGSFILAPPKSFEIDSYPFVVFSGLDVSTTPVNYYLYLIKPKFNVPGDLEFQILQNPNSVQVSDYNAFDSEGQTYLFFFDHLGKFTYVWQ